MALQAERCADVIIPETPDPVLTSCGVVLLYQDQQSRYISIPWLNQGSQLVCFLVCLSAFWLTFFAVQHFYVAFCIHVGIIIFFILLFNWKLVVKSDYSQPCVHCSPMMVVVVVIRHLYVLLGNNMKMERSIHTWCVAYIVNTPQLSLTGAVGIRLSMNQSEFSSAGASRNSWMHPLQKIAQSIFVLPLPQAPLSSLAHCSLTKLVLIFSLRACWACLVNWLKKGLQHWESNEWCD